MSAKHAWLGLAGLMLTAGCQSESQTLGNEQATAMDTATRRAQFEMACPSASGTVLSSTVLQPALWGGVERAEYTIGVAGCGKRATYVSVCPIASLGTNRCFAVAGATNVSVGLRP
jgi:hypothetical protein